MSHCWWQSWDLNSVLSAFKVNVINDYTAFKLDKQAKNNTVSQCSF